MHIGIYNTKSIHYLNGVKWKFQTKDKVRSYPAVYNNMIYFCSYNIQKINNFWRSNEKIMVHIHYFIIYIFPVNVNDTSKN